MKKSDIKTKDSSPDKQQPINQSTVPLGQPFPDKMGTFYALKFPGFRLLWFGSLFSTFSQWVQNSTLSWVIYDMTGSKTLLGTVNGFRLIPNLVISPISGLAADMFDKKKILIYAQLPLLLMTVIMGFLFIFGIAKPWHILLFALLSGIPNAIFQPVRSSMIPIVVPRSALPNAAAMNSGAVTFTRILGPGVGGVMIALFSPAGNFFLQAIAAGLVMISIYMMVLPRTPERKAGRSIKADFVEGLRYTTKNRAVKTLMLVGMFNPLLIQPFQGLLAIFAKDTFHTGSSGFGILLGASGAGAVLGALVIGSMNKFEKRGLIQLTGLIGFGIAIIIFALVHSLLLGILLMALTGLFQLFFLTTNQALIQLSVPSKLMGRVTGIMAIQQGMQPVGSIAAGFMSDLFGAKETVIVMGFMCIGMGLFYLMFFPRIRNLGPKMAMEAQQEAEIAMGLVPEKA